MTKTKSLYHGHRFPAVVISQAVRWYFRFNLSLRDIEELLFERGVTVTYETIRRWCDKFGARFAHRVKAARSKPGGTWHLDEMFVTLRGEPYLLWRAVDEHGAELDILLQKRRDKAAAKRSQARAAFLPSAAQDRHRSVAQLSGGESRDPGAGERQTRVRQSRRPGEQSGREQSPADPRTGAAHARLSRPEAHTGVPIELRPHPAALRAQATSAATPRFIANSLPHASLPGAN